MNKLTATPPAAHQKDGIVLMEIAFDSDTDGWYLYGYGEDSDAPTIELWNMSADDAKAVAENDYGITPALWDEVDENEATIKVVDCNGTELQDGDSVTVIKDLPVKGSSTVIKRGTMIKRIALTDDPTHVDCYGGPVKGLVLKTEFIKKG